MSVIKESWIDWLLAGLFAALLLAHGCAKPEATAGPSPATAMVAPNAFAALQEAAWYLQFTKVGADWTCHAKVDTGGLASKTISIEASSFDDAVSLALEKVRGLNRERAKQ